MHLAIDTQPSGRLETNPNRMWGHSRQAPTPSGSRAGWSVVSTYAQAEAKANLHLAEQRFETYLPLVHTTKGLRPLFPAYLFIWLEPDTPWRSVLYTPGVFDLIRSRETGTPHIARAGAVEALQALEAVRRIPAPPEALWRPGTPCRLASGRALAGHEGVVMEVGKHNAIVGMMLLGHLREVNVALEHLRPREE